MLKSTLRIKKRKQENRNCGMNSGIIKTLAKHASGTAENPLQLYFSRQLSTAQHSTRANPMK